jgi:type II secretory pathway pseudopilin PulG
MKFLIALLVVLGLVGVLAAMQLPEIRRYLKIKSM